MYVHVPSVTSGIHITVTQMFYSSLFFSLITRQDVSKSIKDTIGDLVERFIPHTLGYAAGNPHQVAPSIPPIALSIYSIPEGEWSNFGQLSFGSFYICWSKRGFLCASCTLTAGRDAKPFHSPSAVMKASVFLLLLKVSGWCTVVVQPRVTHPATCLGVQLSCAIVAFQMPTALSWMAEQNTN